DLGLLTGQGLQAQVRLSRWPGADTSDDGSEVVGAAGIASGLDHLEESAGSQSEMLGQGFPDEGQVRVCQGGPVSSAAEILALGFQHQPDDGMVDAQFTGNGADAPAL